MHCAMLIMSGNKQNSVIVSVCESTNTSSSADDIDRDNFKQNYFPPLSFLKKSENQRGDNSQEPNSDLQSTQQHQFIVFILLESFLDLCYYLLLIPIRITKNSSGSYYIKSNCFQKSLCTIVLLIVTIFSLLDLRYYQRQQNLRERPDQTFKYATIFIVHWIPLCWMIIFWLRKDRFVNLLNTCQCRLHNITICGESSEASPESPRSAFRSWGIILRVTIFLTATKNFLLFYNEIDHSESLHHYFVSVQDRFLYNFGLDSHFEKTEWPRLIEGIGYTAVGISFLMEFVIYMFDQLCFTAAVMVFATCQNFLDKFRKLIESISKVANSTNPLSNNQSFGGGNSSSLLRKISTAYLDFITVLDGINKIFGPCIVMFFMYLYPLFIWSFFDSVQNNSLIENLIRIHDMFVLCLVTGTAAEASSKVEQFRQWLFESVISNLPEGDGSSNNELLRLTTMYREVSSEAVGLKGYKFFTVTYRFVATMIGVVITYAIVMFQFVMDPKRVHNSTAEDVITTTLATINNVTNTNMCTC